jgi:hypothetical protein
MDLDPLREKALAAMTATTAQDGATAFGLHTGTEAELAFARALGRLVGALHIGKSVNNRVGKDVWKGWGCQRRKSEKPLKGPVYGKGVDFLAVKREKTKLILLSGVSASGLVTLVRLYLLFSNPTDHETCPYPHYHADCPPNRTDSGHLFGHKEEVIFTQRHSESGDPAETEYHPDSL